MQNPQQQIAKLDDTLADLREQMTAAQRKRAVYLTDTITNHRMSEAAARGQAKSSEAEGQIWWLNQEIEKAQTARDLLVRRQELMDAAKPETDIAKAEAAKLRDRLAKQMPKIAKATEKLLDDLREAEKIELAIYELAPGWDSNVLGRKSIHTWLNNALAPLRNGAGAYPHQPGPELPGEGFPHISIIEQVIQQHAEKAAERRVRNEELHGKPDGEAA
ncbi:hypothetical protein [Paracoccus saliphilus]|uniref:Uncharacterized protein n=1 Tax=Paracoccus saliphilus TaxID=405559 RepID=A0AA45W4M4_9RHOB|nr:hypothetical protein [Paracoccus saliphilus]WCR04555.1 hypothetical protein JHX88_07510 [Paracoccus saliphilus]SIS86751.1 hypothetical protein SAMN05421772_10712 [Paracoccus saliphilus]